MARVNLDLVRTYVQELYGHAASGIARLVVKAPNGAIVNRYVPAADVDALMAIISTETLSDVYISRCTFTRASLPGEKLSSFAYRQRVVTVDLDCGTAGHAADHYPPDEAAALALLEESGLPEASLIMHTGNGLLVHWFLTEAHDAGVVFSLQRGIERQIQLAAERHNWKVDGTSDLARNVRVAGTLNWKHRPDAKPVRVLRTSSKRYALDDLRAFAYRNLPRVRRRAGNVTEEDIAALLKCVPGDGLDYNIWLAAIWAVQAALPEDAAERVLSAWTYGYENHPKPESVETANLGVLINLARKHGYDGPLPIGFRNGAIEAFADWNANVYEVQQRYFDIDLEIDDGVVNLFVVKSPKGTGKTEWLRRVREGVDSAIYISHRVSLVRQAARRIGLTPYYENGRWLRESVPYVATTIHSLDKLEDPNYDVVMIDESEQFLKSLVNDRNLKNSKFSNLTTLLNIIEKARIVILLDADAGQATKYFAEFLCGDDFGVVVNTYQHNILEEINNAPSAEDVLQQAKLSLEQQRRVAVACNTRADADKAYLFLSQVAGKRGLKVTGEGGEGNNVILETINERLENIDFFVYSPSVGTGVSIEIEGFDLFGIARNGVGVGDPEDFLQQLMRFRNPDERFAYVYIEKKRMTEPASPDAYLDLSRLREIEAGIRCVWRNGKREAYSRVDELYAGLYAVVKAKCAALKNDFYSAFASLCADANIFFDDYEMPPALEPDERASIARGLKDARAAEEQARAERIAAAPAEDDVPADAPAEARKDAEEKARLAAIYGIDVTPDLVLDHERGAYSQARRLAAIDEPDLAAWLDLLECGEAGDSGVLRKRFVEDRNYFTLYSFWMRTLLRALNVTLEENARVAATPEFVQLVMANQAVLRAVLNVTVRSDFQKRPMSFISALLRTAGIRLEGKQRREGKTRVRDYTIAGVAQTRERGEGIRQRWHDAQRVTAVSYI